MSLQKDEQNGQKGTQPEDFTNVVTEQYHPDLTWIIERPYQKGVLTKSQISDFNEALRTGRIRVSQTDQ